MPVCRSTIEGVTPQLEATLAGLPDAPRRLPDARRARGRALRRQGPEPARRASAATGRSRRPAAGPARSTGSARRSTASPTSSTRSRIRSARRSSSRPTSSSATSRASTSASRTTRATPTSGSRSARTSRASSGRGSSATDGSRYFGPYASASSVDEAMNLIRRLFPFRTCTIDIREGERALRRPCLLYHIKRCQGPCIEADREGGLPGRHRPGRALPRGPPGDARPRAPARRWRRPPRQTEYERAAVLRDKVRAIERTMEDQKMAAFARTEARRPGPCPVGRPGGGPGLRGPRREADRPRRLPPRGAGRRRRRRGAGRLRPPVLRPLHVRAAGRPRPDAAGRAGRPRGVPGRPARAPRSACRSRERGEKRRLVELAARNAADYARPASRRAGWPTRARRWPRSRSWRRRSAWPAPPLRIECYDISTIQGAGDGRQHGRLRGRQAAQRRLPALPDQGASPARTTSPATPRCSGGACTGRGPGEEGSAEELRWALPDLIVVDGGKGQLGGRRRRASTSSASTTSRSPAWPRSARSSSCPAGRSRSCCRRRRRPSTSCSGSATRRTASRSRTTATCAARRRSVGAFDDLPGVGPRASGRSCGRSARPSGSARRRSSRSRPCPGSGPSLAERIKAHLEAGGDGAGGPAAAADRASADPRPGRRPDRAVRRSGGQG